MPESELRPARPEEIDAIAGLLSAPVPPSIPATTEFSSLFPGTADRLWHDLSIRS